MPTPQESRKLLVLADILVFVISGLAQASASRQKRFKASPTSIDFGSVQVGAGKALTEPLTNSGNSNIVISHPTVLGGGLASKDYRFHKLSGFSRLPVP